MGWLALLRWGIGGCWNVGGRVDENEDEAREWYLRGWWSEERGGRGGSIAHFGVKIKYGSHLVHSENDEEEGTKDEVCPKGRNNIDECRQLVESF